MRSAKQPSFAIQNLLDVAIQHQNEGRLREAERCYNKVIRIDPKQPLALHMLGVIALQVNKNDVAVALIKKALAIKPDFADAYSNLGVAHKRLGNLDAAAASYRKAIGIKPDYSEAHSNLGNALSDFGKMDEAVASYRRALSLKTDNVDALSNLGVALEMLGKHDEAIASLRKAIAIKPDYAEAHSNLGVALIGRGRFDEAVVSCEAAIAINPDYAPAYIDLGNALLAVRKLDDAVVSIRKAIAIKPDCVKAHNNLLMADQYRFCNQSETFEDACRYGEIVAHIARPISNHSNPLVPERRLRVGMISGDFHQHPVGYFLNGVFSRINVKNIELYAYTTHPLEDELTVKIKSNVSKWRQVMGVSDQQLAKDINADGIDILVDLSGHSAGTRLPLFAWKPAPIQVTWIGSNVTTGIKEMDYILCDQWTLPQEEESYFVEKPWHLANTWLCFTPPEIDIEGGPLPVLGNGYMTFGCFNNLAKINDRVVIAWSEVLQAIPNSKLFLKTKQLNAMSVRENILLSFGKNGISRERILLEGHSPRAELLASYQNIDVALDPFPFPGGISSMESLWMGVPVLSVKGERFVSHVAESTLRNVGLSNWIASSPKDLITKAQMIASDPGALVVLRKTLRQRLLESPLCDSQTFANNLSNAFRGMWRTWCGQTN